MFRLWSSVRSGARTVPRVARTAAPRTVLVGATTLAVASAVTIASAVRWQQPVLLDSSAIPGVHTTRQYASAEEIEKVVGLLRTRLNEDQVSTNPDELLSHGVSANTYHAAAVPHVVVYAESTEDVSAVMKLAYEYGVPVTPFSGGTSLEGHITCPFGGICVDLSRMDAIVALHEADSDAVVQAGVQWEALNEELKDRGLDLFFPLDPGPSACIGGMMATGCSGTNAVRYGTAKGEWFLNATVVLPNGEVIKTRQRSRKSSAGYDLTKLFIGAEGTLGIVTEATIRLAPVLPTRVAVCGFPGVEEAVTAVGEVMNRGVNMQCVELCDTLMMSAIKRFGNVNMALPSQDTIFFKFQGADPATIEANIRIVSEIAQKHGGQGLVFAESEAQSDELWRARKGAHWSAMALVDGGTCYSTDVCVPVSNLPRLVHETKQDLRQHGIVGPILGHVGDGNFHCALIFDKRIPGEFEKVDAAAHRMVERAIALDGTCTGEHGVGIGKRGFLRAELGDGTIGVMKTLKDALDPKGIMNPGKLYPD
ncbi:D-lactate ferricytochrome c oxidoreductase [Cryptotrichosporon argae]